MRKHNRLLSLWCFFHFFIISNGFSQFHPSVKIQVEDFNGDGVNDSLLIEGSTGSGFYYTAYTIIDGKGELHEEVVVTGCRCSFINLTPIPEILLLPQNIGFRKALESQWGNGGNGKDFSLDWIINAYLNPIERLPDSIFEIILDPNPAWQSGEIVKPFSRSKIISGDTLKAIINVKFPEEMESEYRIDWGEVKNAWLIYWGRNHKINRIFNQEDELPVFRPIQSSGQYQFMATAHGVVAIKNDQFKWLLVSQIDLTSAPVRLANYSIKAVKAYEDIAIIHHVSPHLGRQRIYIVDIETGKLGNIYLPERLEYPELMELEFTLEGESLIVKLIQDSLDDEEENYPNEKIYTYNLNELQKSLNQ